MGLRKGRGREQKAIEHERTRDDRRRFGARGGEREPGEPGDRRGDWPCGGSARPDRPGPGDSAGGGAGGGPAVQRASGRDLSREPRGDRRGDFRDGRANRGGRLPGRAGGRASARTGGGAELADDACGETGSREHGGRETGGRDDDGQKRRGHGLGGHRRLGRRRKDHDHRSCADDRAGHQARDDGCGPGHSARRTARGDHRCWRSTICT